MKLKTELSKWYNHASNHPKCTRLISYVGYPLPSNTNMYKYSTLAIVPLIVEPHLDLKCVIVNKINDKHKYLRHHLATYCQYIL